METKRKPIRASHLEYTAAATEKGEFLMGGAWGDISGAAIVMLLPDLIPSRRSQAHFCFRS